MSERTTIGGTVYETIGSSSSNLLLRCNGTARIQWGNKLIDLIKNGKLAAADSSFKIGVISDISEIKVDGIYVLNTDESLQLIVNKDGERYNLTGSDLYISASKQQDITAEQRKQALENIGMYYNTLEDVKNAKIQNGLVYVLEDSTLYTIKDGTITEFEAKLKTVTVEQENEQGDVINSTLRIVLSILGDEYLVLEDDRIIVNKSIHVKNFAQLGSEEADATKGYRLYVSGETSHLEVDEIHVRHGLPQQNYIEITFDSLQAAMASKSLQPHAWYLLTDYQNPWKIISKEVENNRPILIQALNEESLYKEGYLFKDRRVAIHYDVAYRKSLTALDKSTESTKGLITWMKDSSNNEANFDFLDYTDHYRNPLTTLHESEENVNLDKSIFPKYSHDNKLIVYDLYGTVIKEDRLDDSNVTYIDFQNVSDDFIMYGNTMECRGLIITSGCNEFYNNTLLNMCKGIISENMINTSILKTHSIPDDIELPSFEKIEDNNIFNSVNFSFLIKNTFIQEFINSTINGSLDNCTFGKVHYLTINESVENCTFDEVQKSTFNKSLKNCTFNKIYESEFNQEIINCTFKDILNCVFHSVLNRNTFQKLSNCIFYDSDLNDITCRSDLDSHEFSYNSYPLLYDVLKSKELYYYENTLHIIYAPEHMFGRGMIMMHSGITPIPMGWAICDGGEYTFNGVTSVTPDLRGRFIKGAQAFDGVHVIDNEDLNAQNELVLAEKHLPSHSHPHQQHSHSFSGSDSATVNMSLYALTSSSSQNAIVSVEGGTSGYSGDSVSGENISDSDTVYINISGTTSDTTSIEASKQWENKSIKIEPQSYSLVFIMKL